MSHTIILKNTEADLKFIADRIKNSRIPLEVLDVFLDNYKKDNSLSNGIDAIKKRWGDVSKKRVFRWNNTIERFPEEGIEVEVRYLSGLFGRAVFKHIEGYTPFSPEGEKDQVYVWRYLY